MFAAMAKTDFDWSGFHLFWVDERCVPQFDIVHRGIGPDAHTASLFPGEPSIDDKRDLARAVYAEKFQLIATYKGEGVIWFLDKAAARLIG